MKIETNKIYNSYVNLQTLVKKYEDSVNNIQLCYNDLSNYWKDNNTEIFFDKINMNKKNVQKSLQDLNSILSLYKEIYNKYKNIGINIEYNLDNKYIITNIIDDCIKIVNNIKSKYLSLSTSNNYSAVSYEIDININLLNTIENGFINLKEKVNNIYSEIKNIEIDIKSIISKIKIDYLKEDALDGLVWK